MRSRAVFGSFLAVLALAAAGSAPAAETAADAGAEAFGVRVAVPGAGGTVAAVSAPPAASAAAPGYAYGDGAVATGGISTTAAAAATSRASASSEATVSDVSLFQGEITVAAAGVRSKARASSSGASGSLVGSVLSGVRILGQPIEPSANLNVPLEDWGYAVLLEQAVVRSGPARNGRRVFVTGLHVHLTAAHGGLPAGADISVGYAESAASAPKPPPDPSPPPSDEGGDGGASGSPSPPPADSSAPSHDPTPPAPGSNPTPPPVVQEPPEDVRPELTDGGYVFPVYGPAASFTDDFAAARAAVGWHHGNDIFAPLGTPILAVTDGELFLVGVNAIGGNRLWLRDGNGNEFYYAHLSAYSPLAYDGSRVRAGDVIGFVGATGDAVGTPPHLHFEIHPAALLGLGYDGVVDPYEYLLAWRRLDDLAFDSVRVRPGEAPPPGAILLEAADISSASGLDAKALARTLEMPALFGEGLGPAPQALTSSPGFAGVHP